MTVATLDTSRAGASAEKMAGDLAEQRVWTLAEWSAVQTVAATAACSVERTVGGWAAYLGACWAVELAESTAVWRVDRMVCEMAVMMAAQTAVDSAAEKAD